MNVFLLFSSKYFCKALERETLLPTRLFLASMGLFVSLSLCLVVLVEADLIVWEKTYGSPGYERAHSLVATSDGGYAIAGGKYPSDAEEADLWLVKTDSFGNVDWTRTYGGPDYDFVHSLVETSDGGYAMAGDTGPYSATDFWLVKTNESGNLIWNQTYGGRWSEEENGYDRAQSLVETSDGGYAIAGYSGQWASTLHLIKTDALGNMEWNQTYASKMSGFPSLIRPITCSMVATSDQGYALAGNFDFDFWLIKTDVSGNVEWNQTYGGSAYDFACSLVTTSDKGYALAGYSCVSGPNGVGKFCVVKIDEFGSMLWNQTYGDGDAWAWSLVAVSDGGYAIAGTTTSSASGEDFWLVKIDEFGNMEWNQTYGGTGIDRAYSLVETLDGGYAIAGDTYSFGAGIVDFWLVKTDEKGVIPEHPSWLLPTLLLTATIIILVNKKQLLAPRLEQRKMNS